MKNLALTLLVGTLFILPSIGLDQAIATEPTASNSQPLVSTALVLGSCLVWAAPATNENLSVFSRLGSHGVTIGTEYVGKHAVVAVLGDLPMNNSDPLTAGVELGPRFGPVDIRIGGEVGFAENYSAAYISAGGHGQNSPLGQRWLTYPRLQLGIDVDGHRQFGFSVGIK